MVRKLNALFLLILIIVVTPCASLADCKSQVKGSSSLSCELNENGRSKLVRELESGDTKAVALRVAQKLTKQDGRRLKRELRELKALADLLDNPDPVASAAAALRDAERALEDFGDPSSVTDDLELENLSNDELKQIENQLREDLQKVNRDNKKRKKDFQNNNLTKIQQRRKLKNFCKKKKKLQTQICTSELICDDGVDEDQDGQIDCDDSDCDGNDSCSCMEGEHAASFNFQSGSFPNCGCYSYAFVQWSRALSQGATRVTALYKNSAGGEVRVSKSDPYSNEHRLGAGQDPLIAPPGTNWIFGAYSTGFDSNLERCSPTCNDVSGLVSNPRVLIDCGS